MSSTVIELLLWLKLMTDSVDAIIKIVELSDGELTPEQLAVLKSKREEAVAEWDKLAPKDDTTP